MQSAWLKGAMSILVGFAALCGTVLTEEPGPLLISGIVRDADGKPVAGAHVEARLRMGGKGAQSTTPRIAAEARTAADGSYVLSSVPLDHLMLICVSHPEWANMGKRVELTAGSEHRRDVDFHLLEAETASGIVVDDGDRPIAGATVSVWTAGSPAFYNPDRRDADEAVFVNTYGGYGGFAKTTTGPDGRFTLTHLPEGWIVGGLCAVKEGYALNYAWNKEGSDRAQRQLHAGKSRSWGAACFPLPCDEVRIVLRRGGSIAGRVVDAAERKPVADAVVTAEGTIQGPYEHFPMAFTRSTHTDATGSYRLDDIPAIELSVQAQRGDSVSSIRTVAVRSDEVSEGTDFELSPAHAIQGTVVDEDGEPVEAVWVHIQTSATGSHVTRTDELGRFHMEQFVREELLIWAYKADSQEILEARARAMAGDQDVKIVLAKRPRRLSAQEHEARRLVGKDAPELDVADWVSGEPTELGSLRGTTAVLAFSDHTDKACAELVPLLNGLLEEYSEKGMEILSVHSADADLDALSKFVSDNSIEFRVAIDRSSTSASYQGATFEQYRVRRVPAVFIIHSAGKVGYQDIPLEAVGEAVKQLLDE